MILDLNNKTVFQRKEISEKELQSIIIENFQLFFPAYRLLEVEFILKGDVRQFGISGRIDILSYDPINKRLVIFELKTIHSKNILIQALDYLDFLELNDKNILSRIRNLTNIEAKYLLSQGNKPEIILIAEYFTHPTLRRVEKLKQPIKLYEYSAFENNMLQIKPIAKSKNAMRRISFNKSQPNSLNINEQLVSTVKELIELDLVDPDYYKVESGAIIFNPTAVYNSYLEFSFNNKNVPLSKIDFFESLKKSGSYLGNKSSTRLGKKNTSAIKIKI